MRDNSKGNFTIKGLSILGKGGNETIRIDELVIDGVTDLEMSEGEVADTNKAIIQVLDKCANIMTGVAMVIGKQDEQRMRLRADLEEHAAKHKAELDKDAATHDHELRRKQREHEDDIEARKHSRIQNTRRNVGDLGTGQ